MFLFKNIDKTDNCETITTVIRAHPSVVIWTMRNILSKMCLSKIRINYSRLVHSFIFSNETIDNFLSIFKGHQLLIRRDKCMFYQTSSERLRVAVCL